MVYPGREYRGDLTYRDRIETSVWPRNRLNINSSRSFSPLTVLSNCSAVSSQYEPHREEICLRCVRLEKHKPDCAGTQASAFAEPV